MMDRPLQQELLEPLAERVHDAWTSQRKDEGWSWGETQDAATKRHPSLVAYRELPESEKEVDRRTVLTTVQGLLDLGCEIVSPRPQPAPASHPGGELLQKLQSAGWLPLAELRQFWSQGKAARESCPAELALCLGDRMLKQGEAILAYDVLSEGLRPLACASGPAVEQEGLRFRMQQLLALAMAHSGAPERAKELLLERHQPGCASPETLGLLGRVYKDLASRATTEVDRGENLAQAFASYCTGFEMAEEAVRRLGRSADFGDAFYCGINAAAVQVLQGRLPEARVLARRVEAICLEQAGRTAAKGDRPDYWLAVTLAEARLISGQSAEAATAYREAVKLAPGNWRELCSTRRQARLLAPRLGLRGDFLEGVFPAIGIAVFLPPPMAEPAAPATLRGWERQQADLLRKQLAEAGTVCSYVSVVSPADLLFIQLMLEAGHEINVVLPCSRVEARRTFAHDPAGAARFDELLARVSSIAEDTQAGCMGESVNRTFARLRALGSGLLRAQRLGTELHLWGEGALALAAGPRLRRHETLPVPYRTVREELTLEIAEAAPAGPEESFLIRSMLFGDVKGYSNLSDRELLHFARVFMGRISEVLGGHSAHILSRRTAGDSIFLVFGSLEAAAAVALALRELVAGVRWEDHGLPAGLGIRISLDVGPIYAFQDAVTGLNEVCGAYVNRAARIEPITPPNEVYASEAFASLYVALGGTAVQFDYVGQTELPKGFGFTPLYCLRRQSPAAG